VSSVLFGIISSSVNAVIVLFATSPVDFEQNHPKLSEEMRNAWREVWPGCMDVLDMRVQVAGFLDPTLNGSMRGPPPDMVQSMRGPEMYAFSNPGGGPGGAVNTGNGLVRGAQSERHPLLRR